MLLCRDTLVMLCSAFLVCGFAAGTSVTFVSSATFLLDNPEATEDVGGGDGASGRDGLCRL